MFRDRQEAGNLLAQRLLGYKKTSAVVVLGIPRGGVLVARPISAVLSVPLGIIVTKKIPAPQQPELAIGAVGPDGSFILDKPLIGRLGLTEDEIADALRAAEEKRYSYSRKFGAGKLELKDKTVIIVDDGAATGSTVELAVKYVRGSGARKVVVALPVSPPEVAKRFEGLADEVVVVDTPPDFTAVGQFYEHFPQVTDREVVQYLKK